MEIRRILTLGAAVGVLAAFPLSATGTASATTSVTVPAVISSPAVQQLVFTLTPPGFAATLDGTDQTADAELSYQIQDIRGSGAGWEFQIAETPFVSGSDEIGALDGLSANDSSQTRGSAVALSVQDTNFPACDSGSTCVVPAMNTAPIQLINGFATTVIAAASETGMGVINFQQDAQLPVPADTYVGTYNSTWTVSLATSP